MRSISVSSLVLAAVSLSSVATVAQSIPNRAALLAALGPQYTHEGFEGLVTGTAIYTFPGVTIDDETVARLFTGTQGPGLVAFGARYQLIGGTLAWLPPGYGTSGNSLGRMFTTGGTIRIDYPVPVAAMGTDVTAFFVQPVSGLATFKDTAGGVLGTVPLAFNAPNLQTAFVGWQSAAGIARVEIALSSAAVFASIDDHDFALDQSLVARRTNHGNGCGAEYASISELFLPSQNPFDLSNQSLRFVSNGNGFVVTRGASAIVPPTAPPLSFTNNGQVIPFPLGWSFPYPGGVTSTLYMSTYGFVHMVPNTDPSLINFLSSGPVIAAKATYMYPTQGGSITLETDPVARTATVTFDQVPESPGTNTDSFQFYFDATGTIEVRYGACSPTTGMVGWSPGTGGNPGSTDLSQITTVRLPAADVPDLGMRALDRPILGQTTNLSLAGIRGGSVLAAHVYGFTRFTPAIDLTSYGMPGCFQHCSADAIEPTVNPVDPVVHPLVVPNSASLVGVRIQVQGVAFHPGNVTPLGVVTSNGVELLLNSL